MPAFILTLFKSKLARQIGAAALFVLSVATFGAIKKREGRTEERNRELLAEAETRKNTKEKTDDAINSVGAMSTDDVNNVLRDKWARD